MTVLVKKVVTLDRLQYFK